MAMNGLFLETWRCPDGVDLGQSKHGPTVFRFRTDRREPLRLEIENLENPVVVEFVNAREDADRIDFFTRFGELVPDMPWSGDYLQHSRVLRVQQKFREYLIRVCGSSVDALTAINEPTLKPSPGKRSKEFQLPHLAAKFDLGGEGGTVRMLLQCDYLITFMRMEMAMAAMQGAKLGTCEHCGDVFLTGPLTGRRSHAKYCSARCRVAAMRARNQAISATSAALSLPTIMIPASTGSAARMKSRSKRKKHPVASS
jgi:hypothetical protein